jgi:thioredoxin reductase
LKPTEQLADGLVIGSYVHAGPAGATSVPGVWVAGTIADPGAGVINTAAAGLNTAAAVNADLIAEDTRRAVTAHRGQFG